MSEKSFKVSFLVIDAYREGAESIIATAFMLKEAQEKAMKYVREQVAEDNHHCSLIQIYTVQSGTIRSYRPEMTLELKEV